MENEIYSMTSSGSKAGLLTLKLLSNYSKDELIKIKGIETLINKFVNDFNQTIVKHKTITSTEFIQQAEEEKRQLLNCFNTVIYSKEITSEYGNYTPWFLVTTSKGIIKIGWRKRVINIDWSESDIYEDGPTLFKGENVSGSYEYEIGHKYIHADNYEKASEYINKLLK